jgi:hypothetical protein
MLSYSQIVKTSYSLTIKNPFLWLFGLFVVGGFNLNFLYFQDIPLRNLQSQVSGMELLQYFETHPGVLAALSALTLVVTFGLLVLTNWCRIMLTLTTQELINSKQANLTEQLKKSPKHLIPVVKVSVLTSALMFVVVVGLLGAPFWLVKQPGSQSFLWTVGIVFLIPLAFTISGINIFTAFYIVLFKQPLGKALNLATDFFVANWAKILGLSAVLTVIYSACFAVGTGLFYLVRVMGNFLLLYGGQFGILHFSAMILVSKGLAGVFLWGLLAGLNVFFNTALLFLFLQLNTPVESSKEKEKEMIVLPASPSV